MNVRLTELKERVIQWLRACFGADGTELSDTPNAGRRMLLAGGLAAVAVVVAGVSLSTPAEAHHGRGRSRRWRRRRRYRRRHRRWRSRRWRRRRYYYRRRYYGPRFILVL